jgi:photosystem II stability/assembly factor-like uncharacterized protein
MKKSKSDHQRTSHAPEANPRVEQDGRDFEMVRRHEEHFDPKRWQQAMDHKRQMPRPPFDTPDPGPAVLQKLKAKDVGIFIGNQNRKASVRASRNPQKNGSFGFVGSFATVAAKAHFLDGILVLRFNRKKLGWVDRESLRIFRWDEKAKQFLKVPGSCVGLERDYVYARISRPGQYSIIGINTYPAVLQTIKAFHGMRGVLDAVPSDLADAIRSRLCQVLLCDSGFMRAMRDLSLVRELARIGARDGFSMPSGDIGELPGDSALCDLCFGAEGDFPREGDFPPEGQILDEPPGCEDSGWESVGPKNMSGCIRQVMLDPNDSNRLYAGADDGGLWVLDRVDAYPRHSWRPLADRAEDLRIRAIAIAPSDSRTIYYANALGHLHKSTDLGESWSQTTDRLDPYVRKILIHPRDPNTVLVATRSGLYVSADGGVRGDFVHPVEGSEILDVVMDQQDSSIIYVAVRNEGVFKNYTSGFGGWTSVLPWAMRTADPPADGGGTTMIKIALAYRNADGSFQSDSNRRVVVKMGREIWVNDRGGRGDWNSRGMINDTGQGDWDHCVAIDPFNPNVFLAGHQDLYRTTDGGVRWGSGAVAGADITHEDQQCIEFDRRTRGVVYSANDGGVFRSTDGGATWRGEAPSGSDDVSLIAHTADEIAAGRNLNLDLVTAQFYRVGIHGDYAVGNCYHLGVISSPNLSAKRWRGLQGGNYEFAQVHADPKRPNRYYVFQSKLARQRYPLSVPLVPPENDFLWYSNFRPYQDDSAVEAMAVDTRAGSNTILVSASMDPSSGLGFRLMITKEGNKEPLADMDPPSNLPEWNVAIDTGGRRIVSVEFAPNTPGKAYAMSSSGQIFSKDDVNAPGGWLEAAGRWPVTGPVRQLAVDSENDRLLYAITHDHFGRSTDGGISWTDERDPGPPRLGVGLPPSEFNSIVAHPHDTFKLYLGAEDGVYASADRGGKLVSL